MAKRKSNITSPISIEVIIIPDLEKVDEAAQRAAPAYRRLLLKQLKLKSPTDKKPPAA